MEDATAGPAVMEPPAAEQRIVGRIRGVAAGPTVVVMCGIHGNEVAGPRAVRRVLRSLQERDVAVRGELLVLAGNLPALGRNQRFVDRDLNRAWTPERVRALQGDGRAADSEGGEQRELLDLFAGAVAEARGTVYFLDLHTSSADGAPFLTVGDTLRNREFALHVPLPIMLGLEEQIDGSLLEYLNNYGFVTVGVEAGQHVAESSVDRHEAVLWILLASSGLIDPGAVADLPAHRALLERAARDIPSVLEVRHRHPITPEDRFRMEPGYVNFQPIRKGDLLASDRHGPIFAREDGRILLPLYQGQGDDGFFISREFRPFWLGVSSTLRRMGLAGIVRFLPGVSLHPEDEGVLVVNTRIARIYPLQIFHLLGFRKLRQVGDILMVSRRKFDLAPPPRISFG